MIYFQLVDNIDNLLEHDFYADGVMAAKNRVFLNMRFQSLEKLTDDLLYHIKIANSIYPTCMTELEERRVEIGKAIGDKAKPSRNDLAKAIYNDGETNDLRYCLTNKTFSYGRGQEF